MRRTHGFPRIAAGVGVGFLLVALLWWLIAIPALVKYPTDVDATPRYAGTFTQYVDAGTGAPLATPAQMPMTIERHIQAIGDQSGSSTVVIRETIVQKAGPLTLTQRNQYVMDRTTLKNLKDDRAYAYDPANVVDRSGAYRLNLPMDTNPTGSYPIYKNEMGTTYQMSGTGVTKTEEGLDLHTYTATATDIPASPAFVAFLQQSVPLPNAMTLDQLKPQLKTMGVDVDALVAAMSPYLTPEDAASFGQIAGKPIPLQYTVSFDGKAGVDTTTGAEVDVGATESVGVKPVFADLPALQTILSHYPNVPEAAAANQALGAVTNAPAIKLFAFTYQQTPGSVADIAGDVKSMHDDIQLAKRTIPLALLGAAFIAFLAAAFVVWHRHPAPELDVRIAPPEMERIPEREKATTHEQTH